MDSRRDSMENLVLSNLPKDTQDLCQDHMTHPSLPLLCHPPDPSPGTGHCSHNRVSTEDANNR